MQRAEAESASDALGIIADAAESGNWRAASWLLENRHGYGDSDELDNETVQQFVTTVQDTIRQHFDDCDEPEQLMNQIGHVLEELADG